MFSMRMPRCIRPRPETRNCSCVGPGATRRATLERSSRSSRSPICRLVSRLPSRPRKRAVVHAEHHVERRLVDVHVRQGVRVVGVGDGVADFDRLEPDDGAQVAGGDFVDFDALQAFEGVELRRPACGPPRRGGR